MLKYVKFRNAEFLSNFKILNLVKEPIKNHMLNVYKIE